MLFSVTATLAMPAAPTRTQSEMQIAGKGKISIEGSKYVAKGKTITLKASEPVRWKSSNKKIATVSSSGKVKGKRAGKVKITATSTLDKNRKASITVTVKPNAVKKISISAATTELDLAGQRTVALKAKASPSNAAQSFTWRSSNPYVASVNKKGKVTAKGTGTAKITAEATDGSKVKKSITITVINNVPDPPVTPPPPADDPDNPATDPPVTNPPPTDTPPTDAPPTNPPTPLQITQQPQNMTVGLDEEAVFTIGASGDGLTYQWWMASHGETEWAMATGSGSDTNTYRVKATAEMNGTVFCCMVADQYGNYLQSESVSLTVNVELTVISQPHDTEAEIGDTISFRFEVKGVKVCFQWYYMFPGQTEWTLYEGAVQDTVSFPMKEEYEGLMLVCMAGDAYGKSVQSDTVHAYLPLDPVITITQQPQSFWTYAGETAAFVVKAKGRRLSYQWYYSYPGDSQWTKLEGAVTDTMSFTAEEAHNGMNVVCMIGNPLGTSVQSDTATLTVRAIPVYRALLIAESTFIRYDDQKGYYYLDVRQGPKGDVSGLVDMFSWVKGPAGKQYQVTVGTDLDYYNVENAIRTTFAGTTENDVSLFYIGTHGTSSDNGWLEMPFVGNFDATTIQSYYSSDKKALPFATLASWLNKYVKGEVIVLVMCCESGGIIYDPNVGEYGSVKEAADKATGNATAKAIVNAFAKADHSIKSANRLGELRTNKFHVIASSRHNESSYDWDANITAFGKCFLTAVGSIDNSPSDYSPQDGYLTMSEIVNCMKQIENSVNLPQHVQCYPMGSNYVMFKLK